MTKPLLTGISAVALATHNMARAVAFYGVPGFCAEVWWPERAICQLSCRQWLPEPDIDVWGMHLDMVGRRDFLCR
jgi:hypothetical protein